MSRKSSLLFKSFGQTADPKIGIVSIVCLLASAAIVWSLEPLTKILSWFSFIIAIIGVIMVRIAMDVLYEYKDCGIASFPIIMTAWRIREKAGWTSWKKQAGMVVHGVFSVVPEMV